ncbi:MAG: RnfABCDGE type electron transport complex subunit D [Clostridia bacterium]|nr:RnfABCDGE type electron transport complex subunit D [Clostridia bacterium]
MPDKRLKNRRAAFSLDFLIATVPLLTWSAFVQGTRVLSLTAVSVAVSLLTDLALSLLRRERRPLLDLTALVTGTTVPLFFPVTSSVFAVGVASALAVFTVRIINLYSPVRCSPALLGAAAAQLIFGAGGFIPYGERAAFSFASYAGQTLSEVPEITQIKADGLPDAGLLSLFFGGRTGLIGDTAVMILVVAFVWLCASKRRLPGAPLVFAGVTLALFYAFPEVAIESDIISLQHAGSMLVCAPYVLVAVFVTGDPAILPRTSAGRIISGALTGGTAFLAAKYLSVWYAPVIAALAVSLLAFPIDLMIGRDNFFGGRYKPGKTEKAPGPEVGSEDMKTGTAGGSEDVVEQGDECADGDENSRPDEKLPDVEDLPVLDKVD